jgi:hypothetical protein
MMTPTATFGILLLSLATIPIISGFTIKAPKLVVFGFIFVLFVFSSSSWGQLQEETTIYSRGTGLFYFSLLNLVLLVAGVAALLKKLANPNAPYLAAPLAKYFLAFVFLLLAHLVLGVMSGIDLELILAYNGIINILNMLIFMYLVIMAFNSEKDQQYLLLTILALAAIRAVFGLIRYFVFDGDSANPYRNFEGLDMKILFFDIADNFVAALAAFIAAWLVTSPKIRLSPPKRLALYIFLALEIAVIALSFRRSSLAGVALMFALLLYHLPGRHRIKFVLLGLGLLSVAAVIFFDQRLQFNNDGGILNSLTYDINPNNRIIDSRFYELYAAAQSIGGNWLFGLGSWGEYSGNMELLDYHFGKLDFVHSGFGHIVLKAGVAGLLIFVGLLLAYASYYFKTRKYLAGNALLLSDAGFAGFLFWVPTLLIGTPIIEFRTMLLIGLTLAMPFVAARKEPVQLRTYYAAA